MHQDNDISECHFWKHIHGGKASVFLRIAFEVAFLTWKAGLQPKIFIVSASSSSLVPYHRAMIYESMAAVPSLAINSTQVCIASPMCFYMTSICRAFILTKQSWNCYKSHEVYVFIILQWDIQSYEAIFFFEKVVVNKKLSLSTILRVIKKVNISRP